METKVSSLLGIKDKVNGEVFAHQSQECWARLGLLLEFQEAFASHFSLGIYSCPPLTEHFTKDFYICSRKLRLNEFWSEHIITKTDFNPLCYG